jgi:hypothetical protein
MTLPGSGSLSINQINSEFGRGNNLNSYRGTIWYTDDGGSGYFSGGTISIAEFYGKSANPAAPELQVSPAPGFYSDFTTFGSITFYISANFPGTFTVTTYSFVQRVATYQSNGSFSGNTFSNATWLQVNYNGNPGVYNEWSGNVTYCVQHPWQGYVCRSWDLYFQITNGQPIP